MGIDLLLFKTTEGHTLEGKEVQTPYTPNIDSCRLRESIRQEIGGSSSTEDDFWYHN